MPGQLPPTPRHSGKNRKQREETRAQFQLALPIPSAEPCMSLLRRP